MVDVPAVHRTKPGASGNCVASSGLCLVQLPSPRTRRADVLADIARSLPGAGIVAGCATNCIRRALFLVVDRKRVDASTVSVARQTETTVGRPNGRIRTSGDAGAGLSVRDPGSVPRDRCRDQCRDRGRGHRGSCQIARHDDCSICTAFWLDRPKT